VGEIKLRKYGGPFLSLLKDSRDEREDLM
jgi:hypothetical protein